MDITYNIREQSPLKDTFLSLPFISIWQRSQYKADIIFNPVSIPFTWYIVAKARQFFEFSLFYQLDWFLKELNVSWHWNFTCPAFCIKEFRRPRSCCLFCWADSSSSRSFSPSPPEEIQHTGIDYTKLLSWCKHCTGTLNFHIFHYFKSKGLPYHAC